MCGIALVISGDLIVISPDSQEPPDIVSTGLNKESWVLVDHLKAGLHRRGPDSISSYHASVQIDDSDGHVKRLGNANRDGISGSRLDSIAELFFMGATLQLRGIMPVTQPFVTPFGNAFVYNGEVFGGIDVDCDKNDAESLLSKLESCCSCDCHALDKAAPCSCCRGECKTVAHVLSKIKGPWALLYWQAKSKTMWFGRDAFGRRSLLVHWSTSDGAQFVLSSVAASSFDGKYFEELPCGIYSVNLKCTIGTHSTVMKKCVARVRKHEWMDLSLRKLVTWEREKFDPNIEHSSCCCHSCEKERHLALFNNCLLAGKGQNTTENDDQQADCRCILTYKHVPLGCLPSAEKVLLVLHESIRKRSVVCRASQMHNCEIQQDDAPVAVLFSGGLDSMLLAALLDKCLESIYSIDLLNVSFDGNLAPDRISANAGLMELKRISPSRRWRLVEIDADLSNLRSETEHVITLIHPSKTYMDLNIGLALWLASGGDGWVYNENFNQQESCLRVKYKSNSKVLLVGSGADEQCAGYGRHKTKYGHGGWLALNQEMRLDMQRIWKRNMGRDDRCISDRGKEARFPFLDEDVIRTLLEFPLWEIAKLDEPIGIGDKKILRQVAMLLGLQEAATLPKRAIQFGSRIARESNRKNFGSNRAANQASAGSVVIHPMT